MVWMPWRLTAGSSGSHISMFPPRPMTRRRGGPSPRIDTRRRWPSTRTNVRSRFTANTGASQVDVPAGRGLDRWVSAVARLGGAPALAARALAEPPQPVVPPAALARGGAGPPFEGIGRRWPRAGQEPRPLGPRGVDDGLDVAARAEHELAVATQQLGGLVGRGPRDDVVGRAGHDVGVAAHDAEVDRGAEHLERSRSGEAVGVEQIEEVRVQPRGEVGAVGVPVEDVERRRVLPEQVVVDPVVPDQVVGPQPGEHPGEGAAVGHTPALWTGPSRLRGRP